MALKLNVISDVVESQLCCGCGACAYISPELYSIEDVEAAGRRPRSLRRVAATDVAAQEARRVCPGAELSHDYDRSAPGLLQELAEGWGPVLGVWEGHATDEVIRFRGSSGGAITALAVFGLESGRVGGVLHTVARKDDPILNETVLSRSRRELTAGAGSRYSPASPCERLDLVEDAAMQSIFIGKPCDVAAVGKVRRLRPELDRKVALTIALFCAGTPSTGGTRALLNAMGLSESEPLSEFRYRGQGWPGEATAQTSDGRTRQLSYQDSWGKVLTRHVQWRCRLCPDHTGEFADIAVGDPWYREPKNGEAGSSLIVARSAAGKAFIEAAIAAGHLLASPVNPDLLPASQPNLLRTRGAVWGRMLGCRLAGFAVPRYRRLSTFQFWISELGASEKARSIFGTIARVRRRFLRPAGPAENTDVAVAGRQ